MSHSNKDPDIAYLTQESEQFEAAVVDLQLGCAWEAAHAIGEIVKEVEEVLSHGGCEWAAMRYNRKKRGVGGMSWIV